MKSNTYIEKERAIEVVAEVDVLVVGGGPAGVGAAIGAAKTGVSVMLIEAMGSFGGMWTNGLVITLAGFNSWLSPYRRCVGGVMEQWLQRACRNGGAENNRSWVLNSDPEIMKVTADEMLLENKVKCLLHTWVADVIREEDMLKGIIIENVDGRKAIFAKTIVDCTGNGDLLARAAEPFFLSSELQPMTLPFFLADVKPEGTVPFEEELVIPFGPEPGYLGEELLKEYTSRRRDVGINRVQLDKAFREKEIPFFGGPWFGGMRKKYPWVNTTRVYGSAVNADELTQAEMEARKNVHEIAAYYKKECAGFKDCWIMNTGATIGIRETRRLDGLYCLTEKDILLCRNFPDTIALGVWPLDVHPPKGENGMHDMYVPLPYQIPLRSLLPKTLKNLVVGGRCISTDRKAMGSARVGATCGATGQAAGIAAALSVHTRQLLPSLPVGEIQRELVSQGGIIE